MIKAVLKVNGSMLGTDSLVRLMVLKVPWPVSITERKLAKPKKADLISYCTRYLRRECHRIGTCEGVCQGSSLLQEAYDRNRALREPQDIRDACRR